MAKAPSPTGTADPQSALDGAPGLLIVTGPPCAGKTTLATRVARELRLPLLSKDGIKERLADLLPSPVDRQGSQRLGRAAMEMLYYVAERHLEAGQSLAIEGNFEPPWASARFREMRVRVAYNPRQILCIASPEVLGRRHQQRVLLKGRHPVHVDVHTGESMDAERLLTKHGALEIDGDVLVVDTGEFNDGSYRELVKWLQPQFG
ncbi:MAG: AAA family ATPase [Chloroflexota bacterium]